MDTTANPYEQFYLHKEMLSLVMPAYNEGTHIYDNLLRTSRTLAVFASNYEIIIVDDGSTDNTCSEARHAASDDEHIKVISYTPNKGKGGAIREGVMQTSGEYIGFCDSDLDLDPAQLRGFLYELEEQDADIAIGSKLHPDSQLDYPKIRRVMSYGYYVLLKLLFHLNTHDTQTGLKLFRGDTIRPIIKHITTDGYAFDIEILATAAKKHKKIIELPVEVVFTRDQDDSGSRIRIRDIFRMILDTFAIHKRLRHPTHSS